MVLLGVFLNVCVCVSRSLFKFNIEICASGTAFRFQQRDAMNCKHVENCLVSRTELGTRL